MESLSNWLQNNMLACFSKKYFHIECPGCGLQRSLVALLKGDVIGSLKLNAGLIPLMLLISTLLIHLIFKLKHGAKILLVLQIVSASTMIVQYFIKQYYWLNEIMHAIK